MPYTSSFTKVKDGHAYVNRTLHGRLTHDKLLRPRKYDSCVPILSAFGLERFSFERFPYVSLTHNLRTQVPLYWRSQRRNLVKSNLYTWSPVRNVTGYEGVHARNKSSTSRPFFDVLNNEFDRAVKFFSNYTIHFINYRNWVFHKWFTGLIRPSNVRNN